MTLKDDLYARGSALLGEAWDRSESQPTLPPEIDRQDLVRVIAAREKSLRTALVGQLALKVVLPSVPAKILKNHPDFPPQFSARSFARNTLPQFDSEHESLLAVGPNDPYSSNPLRNSSIEPEEDPNGEWKSLFKILDVVDGAPELAAAALAATLHIVRQRQLTLHRLLTDGLALQKKHGAGINVTSERNELFETRGPAFVSKILPAGLDSDGGAQTGSSAEIPWVRIYSKEHAPSAQEGWYLVYLFAADGSEAYLSLIQGVTHVASAGISAGAGWAREVLGDHADLEISVDLHSRQGLGGLPERYQRGALYSKRYPEASLPVNEQLQSDLEEMTTLLQNLYAAEESVDPPLASDFSELTVQTVLDMLGNLRLPESVTTSLTAALRAGKHVLLTGPPGTGKTSLAQAVSDAAQSIGLCAGGVLTTGTADWTSADTVGGYWPARDDSSRLEFKPGVILSAIQQKKWVIIDELNRTDIDKAIGQLFTVLSGQAVVLPYEEIIDGVSLPVSIVPSQANIPDGTSAYRVPKQWRLIATLNTRDRDLLFNVSYALMRRFAVIDVPVPIREDYLEILKAKAQTGSGVADQRVQALIDLPHRKLGPSLLIDVAAFVRERLKIAPDEIDAAFEAALLAYVLPQLDDVSKPQQIEIARYLKKHVLKGRTRFDVAYLVADTFHAAPEDLASVDSADEAETLDP